MSRRPRFLSIVAVTLAAGCAAPPPPAPPVVSYQQKMSWILRLEDQRVLRDPAPPPVAPAVRSRGARSIPGPPIPDLIRLLEDEEARVRRRAVLAVGRVGLAEAVPAVSKLLAADAEPEVRQMAAFALALIGDRTAAEVLINALGDPEALVQGRAAQALGMLGVADAADAIGRMVAGHAASAAAIAPDELGYPLEPRVEAFRLGVYALAQLKAYPALASAVLDGAHPRVLWWPVAYALQRIEDPRAYDALAAFVRGEGTYGAVFAARGLGALKNPAATQLLLALLDPHRDWRLVISAVRGLAALGQTDASPVLLKFALVRDLDPNLRLEAVTALGELRAPGAVNLYLDLLSDRWPSMRAAALRGLANTDPETFVLVLSSRDPDTHWTVRAALAGALASIDPAVALPQLTAMLGKDEDQRVVPAVLASLVRLQAPNVAGVLVEHLKSRDVVVRMRAARLLADLKPPDGPSALAEAYRLGLADNTYIARAAAVDALAAYGLPAAREVLETALTDKDWAVRVRAASELLRLDPAGNYSQRIRPAPTQLAPGAYEEPSLVQPSVSPHLYIETEKGVVQVELAVLDAPLAARSVAALARAGFFNGLSFHRVVPNFVVQDGDPRGDGEGGPGYTLRDEVSERPYLRGVVGIALDWADTGGSQYFITHSPQPHLDARYTVIGRVVDGMAVVDRLQEGDAIRRMWVWDGTQSNEASLRY